MHKITFTLLVIGGLNWLLEAFGFGIGNYLPGIVSTIIYILVGLSAIVEIAAHGKNCRHCGQAKQASSMGSQPGM